MNNLRAFSGLDGSIPPAGTILIADSTPADSGSNLAEYPNCADRDCLAYHFSHSKKIHSFANASRRYTLHIGRLQITVRYAFSVRFVERVGAERTSYGRRRLPETIATGTR
jgi:hypothetical protein